jgi:plastocyanin
VRRTLLAILAMVLLTGSLLYGGRVLAQVKSNDTNVAVMDDCDPNDPAWAPTGGCTLRTGTVDFAGWISMLFSPLAGDDVIGHPSWRNEPAYLATRAGRTIRVRNWGGRAHTYTKVAQFGGGYVPPLNGNQQPAPECDPATVTVLQPGETERLDLPPGTHKFQCCIHPWMRGTIDVQ